MTTMKQLIQPLKQYQIYNWKINYVLVKVHSQIIVLLFNLQDGGHRIVYHSIKGSSVVLNAKTYILIKWWSIAGH